MIKKKKTSTKPLLLSLANIPLIYKKPKHDQKKSTLFFNRKRPRFYLLLELAVTLRRSSTLEEEGQGKTPRSILH